MQVRKQLEREARSYLKGAWLGAAALFFLITAVKTVCTFSEELASALLHISYFQDSHTTPDNYLDNSLLISPLILLIFVGGLVLRLLLVSPFALGQKSWYQHLAAGNPAPFGKAFQFYGGFRRYTKAVVFTLRLTIRRILLICLCFFPLIALLTAIPFLVRFSIPAELFWLLIALTAAILFLASTAVAAYWLGRYFLAEYIFVLFDCKMRDAFKLSAVVMKERKNEWLSLLVSLLPYYMADLLIVPMLYTVPYRSTVFARYARHFMESYEKAKEAAPVKDRAAEFATREFSYPS